MTLLCLQEEESLSYKVQGMPAVFVKRVKSFQKSDILPLLLRRDLEN